MDSLQSAHGASPGKVLLALLSVYLVWGSTYLAIRIGLQGYPPFLMGGLRFIAASLAFYSFLRWQGHAAPTRAQWRNAAVLGLFMMLLGNGLVNLAEKNVSSGLAAIAVASMPLWAGLFGALKGRHPSRGEWLGLVIGFAGVVWLNFGSAMSANVVSMIALIMAPVSWAFGSVWSRDRDLPGPFMSTAAQMLCGGIAMLIVGLALGERIHALPALQPTLAVGYLAVFGSIIGFSAYVWLLHHVRPALATSYAYVNPPIAVLLGAVLLHEKVDAHVIGAMAVILLGVIIITRAKARAS
ncbi:MAG TPA: drug/metabolite exporter YedA [Arenimonas sp.]|uniref:drug/metabolite exporter YedA n=1 Tax=Arenimonas sp. TaxID=1872635 RepID=UPI002C5BA3BB|nr:drug/metabolite exporter YedA [Arenimonas sp.]HMB57683.1 drug/metabolite exporter YedA [Arenimonas sp.]